MGDDFYAVVAGIAPGPGPVTNARWDGLQEDGSDAEPGTYTFDILVQEIPDLSSGTVIMDEIQMKSSYKLRIPPNYIKNNVTKDGHAFNIVGSDAVISYYLTDSDNMNGTEFKVDVIDPELQTKASHLGQANINTEYENIRVYTLTESDPVGEWRGVFTASDSHKLESRDHQNKRMLAINGRNPVLQASNYDVKVFRVDGHDDELGELQASNYEVKEWGLFGFSTARSAKSAYLTQNHDYKAQWYTNTTAATAETRYKKDKVFWFAGHGAPTYLNFAAKNDGAMGVLTFPGSIVAETDNRYMQSSSLKFFGATGCTMATGVINMATEAIRLGAEGVLGFASSPESGWCERYSDLFWHYALQTYTEGASTVKLGKNHSFAATAAAVQLAAENNGDFHGFHKPRLFGTSVKLSTHKIGT